MGLILLYFSLSLTTSAGAHAKDEVPSPYEAWKITRSLDQMVAIFGNRASSECASSLSHASENRVICDFKSVCESLHSQGSARTIFYRNSNGEILSNEPRKRAQIKLLKCAISRRNQLNKKDSGVLSRLVYRLGASSDPTALDQALASLQAQPRPGRSVKEIESVIDRAKERIAAILEKRRTSQNSSEIENLKRRLHAIRFVDDNIICNKSEAAYRFETNTIRVCETARTFPEGTLFTMIAHELAHSLDPCSSLFAAQSANVSGILASRYPFNTVMRCLAGENSTRAAYLRRELIEKQYADFLSNLNSHSDQTQIAKARENRSKALAYSEVAGFCAHPDRSPFGYRVEMGPAFSQAGEVMADWFAAEAVALEMDALSSQRKYEMAFEAALLFQSECENNGEGLTSDEMRVASELGCTVSGTLVLPNIADEHLSGELRVDQIFLAQPKLKRALGCMVSYERPHCE